MSNFMLYHVIYQITCYAHLSHQMSCLGMSNVNRSIYMSGHCHIMCHVICLVLCHIMSNVSHVIFYVKFSYHISCHLSIIYVNCRVTLSCHIICNMPYCDISRLMSCNVMPCQIIILS